METLMNMIVRIPPGVWAFISLVCAIAIFVWLQKDIQARHDRKESRAERMTRLKQEAIEKLRAEKDGR